MTHHNMVAQNKQLNELSFVFQHICKWTGQNLGVCLHLNFSPYYSCFGQQIYLKKSTFLFSKGATFTPLKQGRNLSNIRQTQTNIVQVHKTLLRNCRLRVMETISVVSGLTLRFLGSLKSAMTVTASLPQDLQHIVVKKAFLKLNLILAAYTFPKVF